MFKIRILFYWLTFKWRGYFRDRTALSAFQNKKLRQFFKTVLPHAPFYAPLLKMENKLDDFPLVNKEFFMENFEALNTKSISKEEALHVALKAESDRDFRSELKGVTIGLSTGTSGKRGIFMVSEDERAQWAAMVMTRVVTPKLFKKQKVAFFLRANSNLYSSVQSALFEFRYFDIFQPIEILAKELERFQPHVLAAQPSILVHLAEFQSQNRITIQPEQLVSFAEVLYPEDKQYILSIFKCGFKEVYQCTEGFLGVTCAHGKMHLNEDILFFEKKYIDEKRFHPILTDFTRSTQPMVRYELNDILVESKEPCACGSCFTALERIEGRANDIFIFKDTENKILRIYPDLIARTIARTTDDFRTYRIVQHAYRDISVALELNESDFEAVKDKVEKVLQDFLKERRIEGVTITFKHGIAQEAGAKHRKIERRFDDEN